MIVLIKSAETKTSNAGKAYLRVFAGGKWHSCWDAALSDEILNLVGKEVDIQTETKGKFSNIISVGKASTTPQSSSSPTASVGQASIRSEFRTRLEIIRSDALHAAVAYYNVIKPDIAGMPPTEIIARLTDKFATIIQTVEPSKTKPVEIAPLPTIQLNDEDDGSGLTSIPF